MKFRLIFCLMAFSFLHSALLRGQFLIAAPYQEQYAIMAHQFLTGNVQADEKIVEENRAKAAPFMLLPDGSIMKADNTKEDFNLLLDKAPAGSVPIIQVVGATMKEDFCGFPGTNTIASWVQKSDNHKNSIGTLLLADTPGGSADGPNYLGNIIKSSKKPVGVYVDGLLASAGVFWSATADFIMANTKAAMIGSIGTMTTLADYTKRYEMMGIKVENVVSDLSQNKNKAFYEAQKGNTQQLKDEILNPLTAVFHAYVVENRSKISQKESNKPPLDGSMFMAEKALELGLIDSIGSLADAVSVIKELAGKQAKNEYKLKLVS